MRPWVDVSVPMLVEVQRIRSKYDWRKGRLERVVELKVSQPYGDDKPAVEVLAEGDKLALEGHWTFDKR